ncbi:MAG TPA: M56 family metallopeptidase, partial [Longimicrobiaceae bacterium]|nr:M56 family metallopeptidase [Longimicrobiaceae bacterium]
MIAQWMAYAAAVALMCGLGALALERALVLYGRPTRWVWAAAMALSVAAPVAARVAPRAASEAAPLAAAPVPLPSAVGPSAGGTMVPLSVLRAIAMADDAEPRTVSLDTPLLVGWTAASAALLAVLGGLAMTLVRRRRVWRREVLDGVAVLVSEDSGPAVVGLFRSDIVVPEWVLHASPAQRELMLVHEEEHVAAGDPRLLGFALALLVLMPWSPALWWQLRRLRLAVEVDCDARVLARRADVRSYGALLLEMGRRASAGMLAVAAFSEPVSFLERRIRIMTTPKVRTRLLRASGFAGVAVLFAAAASATPRPQLPPAAPPAPPAPAAAPRAAVAPAPPAAPAVRVRAAVAPTPPTPPAAPARPAPAPAPAKAPSPPPQPAAA